MKFHKIFFICNLDYPESTYRE